MRSTYSPDVLFVASAKKKPRLKALLDALPSMSQSDIDSLNEPLWIKKSLTILKIRGGKDQKEFLNDLIIQANAQVAKEDAARSEKLFQIKTWNNQNDQIFAKYPGTKITAYIEIKYGEPFLIQTDSVIVLSGEFLELSEQEMNRILVNSDELSAMTLQGYFNHYRDVYLNSRY